MSDLFSLKGRCVAWWEKHELYKEKEFLIPASLFIIIIAAVSNNNKNSIVYVTHISSILDARPDYLI